MNGGATVGLAWIIGAVGIYQILVSMLAAVAVFGGRIPATPFVQGETVGGIVGGGTILAIAFWLHRKGWAKIRADKERLLAMPSYSPAQKRWHWQLIIAFVIFVVAVNIVIRAFK